MNSKRHLILFQNGSIGDFLMSIYLAELMYATEKFSRVTIIVPRGASFLQGFLKEYSYISLLEISGRTPLRLLKLFPFLFSANVAVIPPTPGSIPRRVKRLASLLSKVPGSEVIGFDDGDSYASNYSHKLRFDTTKTYPELMQSVAALFVSEGTHFPGPKFRYMTGSEALQRKNLEQGSYLFFHPFGSNPERSFDIASASEFLKTIHGAHPELSIILSGGPGDAEKIKAIAARVSGSMPRIIPLAGASAEELIQLLLHAKLFIGVDTGITHLASFLGVKSLEVAHHGTSHWLAFYGPRTTVIYKLKGESETHRDREYLETHRGGEIKPLDTVPNAEIIKAAGELL